MTNNLENIQIQEQQKKEAIKSIYNDKIVGNFTKNELDTLRNTIARGTTDDEFRLFVQTCVNTGLNPFLNHIHCMVYEGRNGRQLSIQISSEGILYLARKAKGFKGIDAQMVHENDDFRIDMATKKIIKHEIGFPRGQIIGGYCIARHADFEDKILIMDVAEVEHMKRGKNGHMWNTWFADMFKKHMLKRVAKEQYGIDLTEGDDVPVTSASKLESYQPKDQELEPGLIQVSETEIVKEDDKIKELWAELDDNVPQFIIMHCMQTYFRGKREEEFELADVVALKKFCQLEMQQREQQQFQPNRIEEAEPVELEPVPTDVPPERDEIVEYNSFFD